LLYLIDFKRCGEKASAKGDGEWAGSAEPLSPFQYRGFSRLRRRSFGVSQGFHMSSIGVGERFGVWVQHAGSAF
jgi:hypothetical protein